MIPNQHLRIVLSLSFISIISLLITSCGDESPQGPGDTIGIDTIPPAVVTDLVAKSPTASSLALVWVAPGDDGTTGQAARYHIRYSSSHITDQNWDLATPVSSVPKPKPAGQIETVVVTGLPPAEDIYFALKTCDEVPNESELSNCAMGTTNQEKVPPAAVTDLKADAISQTEFLLTWTAPGDDIMEGTASEYDIRYSYYPINKQNWAGANHVIGEPAPKPGGQPDSFIVTGMAPGMNYYFAMKTADDVPNWSMISNLCPALALSKYLWVTPSVVTVGDETQVVFRASSTEATKVNIWRYYYDYPTRSWKWIIFKHLVDGMFPGGSHAVWWDLKDDDGNPVPDKYAVQYPVKLHWGETPIDSTRITIEQPE